MSQLNHLQQKISVLSYLHNHHRRLRHTLANRRKQHHPQEQHLKGPVDGSLYATILKSRKCPSVILSPPVEFRGSLSPYSKSRLSTSTQSLQVYPTSHHSHDRQQLSPTPSTGTLRNTPTINRSQRDYSPSLASTVADSVHFQRSFSTPPQERVTDQRYQTINHQSSSSANYRHHHHPQRSTPQQFVQEIRIVEEFQEGGGGGKSSNAKLGGNARDSLTLSMDSGISSSGQQLQQKQLVQNNTSK